MDEATTMYRLFDADDQLLYVGISRHWGRRMVEHTSTKLWWRDVARVEIRIFHTRLSAESAERAAIKEEAPKYNVVHATVAPEAPALWGHVNSISHAEIAAALPAEYLAARKALDALANATRRVPGVVNGQRRFCELVSEIAATNPYGDCCKYCGRISYPLIVERKGSWIKCGYWCCESSWSCGWSIDLPVWLAS